jgi:hypothetical protein
LAQDSPARNSPERQDYNAPYDEYDVEEPTARPSLPIILISAAAGIAGGVVALYVTYLVLGLDVPISVFFAVLGLSFGVGVAGTGLSLLTRSKAAIANIVFSCGLILASLAFFGLCTLFGALGATLLLIQ